AGFAPSRGAAVAPRTPTPADPRRASPSSALPLRPGVARSRRPEGGSRESADRYHGPEPVPRGPAPQLTRQVLDREGRFREARVDIAKVGRGERQDADGKQRGHDEWGAAMKRSGRYGEDRGSDLQGAEEPEQYPSVGSVPREEHLG